jgi:hypothetical protein
MYKDVDLDFIEFYIRKKYNKNTDDYFSVFKNGMTWENYGEWHIDHIRPVSSFDKDDEVSVINSLENLQPLWAYENLSKSKKYNK